MGVSLGERTRMLVSVNSMCNEFVVQVSVQMLDVYLVVAVKYTKICMDPRVVCLCVTVCVCLWVSASLYVSVCNK